MTALVFLRDAARLQAGQTILINGASGSVGGAAIQLAKHFGAEVTGVCSTPNLDLVAALGADHVIDYTRQDFTTAGDRYDVIFDAVGTSSYRRCQPLLNLGGTYLTTAPSLAILLQTLWTAKIGSRTAKIVFAGLDRTPGKLDTLTHLTEIGALLPVVDRRYPSTRSPKLTTTSRTVTRPAPSSSPCDTEGADATGDRNSQGELRWWCHELEGPERTALSSTAARQNNRRPDR